MEKIFGDLKGLMEFDFSDLTASMSNYITVLTVPKVKKNQSFGKWRVVEKPKNISEPMILIEITPRWLTITVYREKGRKSMRIDINCFRKDPKAIIQSIFEF